MSEWQPIETAPKDDAFIIYFKNGDPVEAFHYDIATRWGLASMSKHPLGTPTHWMPLPDPPQ